MAERQLPKLDTRVRFPSPAPLIINDLRKSAANLQHVVHFYVSFQPFRGLEFVEAALTI